MIHYIPGCVRCPFADIGTRDAHASNRLFVDEPARARIEGAQIELEDDRDCPPKTPIADLVWLAEANGVHFTIHAEITKTGRAWDVDLHTHEPLPIVRRAARYEPIEIAANGQILVDRERLARAVAHVPIGRRIASALTTMRDHRTPGARFDRSIGIGALGRGSFLVRARVTDAELSLEALTERWLPALVQRDLVLFGLADLPLLRAVKERGLRLHQRLAFDLDTGAIRLDDATAPLPDAHEVARAYLEFHMLGGIIGAALRDAR